MNPLNRQCYHDHCNTGLDTLLRSNDGGSEGVWGVMMVMVRVYVWSNDGIDEGEDGALRVMLRMSVAIVTVLRVMILGEVCGNIGLSCVLNVITLVDAIVALECFS